MRCAFIRVRWWRICGFDSRPDYDAYGEALYRLKIPSIKLNQETMKKVLIGHVAVDSGQLMLCDPCYVDEHWREEEFNRRRVYKHTKTGDLLEYRVDFEFYDSPIEKYGGQKMNQLLQSGVFKEADIEQYPMHPFSYNACCYATLSKDGYGQLGEMPLLGIAFSTVHGDGVYPVYGNYNNNKLQSITIDLNP